MSGDLERRYRRVLRLLPGWYRERWEQDMVATFLDSWLTGDAHTDECVLEFCKPAWAEVASVVLLAAAVPGRPGHSASARLGPGPAARGARRAAGTRGAGR